MTRDRDDPIVVIEYDPAWPSLFQEERSRILAAFRRDIPDIEHIGSTAVLGLAAKPVLDILVGVRALPRPPVSLPILQEIGYEHLGEHGIPGRQFFRKGSPRSHHLHLVTLGDEFWRRHLLFRDYLRLHPEEVLKYAALKRDLARQHRTDREGYTRAKSDYIGGILVKAGDGLGRSSVGNPH